MKKLILAKEHYYYMYFGLPFVLYIDNRCFTSLQTQEIIDYLDDWEHIGCDNIKDLKEYMEYRDWQLIDAEELDVKAENGYMYITRKEK